MSPHCLTALRSSGASWGKMTNTNIGLGFSGICATEAKAAFVRDYDKSSASQRASETKRLTPIGSI